MKKVKAKKSNKNSKKSEKIIILENKKRFEEIKSEERAEKDFDVDEDLEEDVEFSEGFHLSPSRISRLENIPQGNSLEGTAIFFPRARIGRTGSVEPGKDYAAKYDLINYSESNKQYAQKTPGMYAEKSESSKESSSSGSSGSNGSGSNSSGNGNGK